MQGAEFILMLSKRPHRTINDMGSSNIIRIPNEVGKKEHPTQKPIELYNYLIKNSTNKEDIVLDPFAGRGTIAMSCIQLDRKFIGFELDDEYYQMCLENIKKAKGEVGLFA
jgi:site-specific DNA-methyltransferase (adenine-specific)